MMITNYTVTGMTCGNCAKHITEEVLELDGVTNASVSHETNSMSIESAERLPFDAVIAAVQEAGDYTVTEA